MTAEQREVPGRSKEKLEAEEAYCRRMAEKENVAFTTLTFVQFIRALHTVWPEASCPEGTPLEALGGWQRTTFGYRSSTEPHTKELLERAWVRYENDSPKMEELILVDDCDGNVSGEHHILLSSGTGKDKSPFSENLNAIMSHYLLGNACRGLWELYNKHKQSQGSVKGV